MPAMIEWLDSWEQGVARARETGKAMYLFLFSPT